MELPSPNSRIVVVDDEFSNVLLLERTLAVAGYKNVRGFTDPQQFLAAFPEENADLILLDWMMPGLSGLEVMERLRGMIHPDTFLPILVLTADVNPQSKRNALASLATDFLTKPFDTAEVLLRIRNLLWTRQLHLNRIRHEEELEETVRERTLELRAALKNLSEAQQQTIQHERMRSLTTMAGGVAHELNNALSIILGFGEIGLGEAEKRPNSERETRALRSIVLAAQEAAGMVMRLREFSRPPANEVRQAVDLSALARQAIGLTEPRWKTQAGAAGISISIAEDFQRVPLILGDPAELREIATNLLFNAIDAIPQGGTITARTRFHKNEVELSVTDTGTGMTDEVRERCREPFFTTKGDKGTGLGLAVVYGIVSRHGGSMEIESQPGIGTTVICRFPTLLGASGASPERLASECSRILIIEPNAVFREILAQFLAQDCHGVETADSGHDALEKLDGEPFDLIITNQCMPGMAGSQFITEARRRRPDQPVILLTGFGEFEIGDTGGANIVLSKPASQESLRRAIASVLSEK